MSTLVAGWFSFDEMGATAGDLLARDLVCDWLREAGREVHIAEAEPGLDANAGAAAGVNSPGVSWRAVDPADYDELVFVCGPFGNGPPVDELLARFAQVRLVGVNLSMLEPLDSWNPFDLLLERDSSETARPDISFLSTQPLVPVAGLVLVHPQDEYEGGRHANANAALEDLIARRALAHVRIDTRLDVPNAGGLRAPAEIESLIAKMDVVLTTRLHGSVLALKNGVPPLAVDPIAGGAKVSRQLRAVGWPALLGVDDLSPDALDTALDYCLSPDGLTRAEACRRGAVAELASVRERFVAELGATAPIPR